MAWTVWKFGAALITLVIMTSSCASSGAGNAVDELGLVETESVTNVLAQCPDLPFPNEIDEIDFESRTTLAFEILGFESGYQGGGARAEGLIGLEFVDPSSDGFDELLERLPEGFCIDSIRLTPEAPDSLDVIDESGQVSALPESVTEVGIWFAPDSGEPEAEATELILSLVERECASEEEMGDRLIGPEVHESADQILIAAGAAIQLTEQECPGNPATEVTVTLDAPVGDREIRNGLTGELIQPMS